MPFWWRAAPAILSPSPACAGLTKRRGEFLLTTTPSAYASLRRDTPSPAKGTIERATTKGDF
ncbi:MAG: hypothetical protein LBB23_01375 [Rickettsiales bacterium]|nr:hypothetical protein [Rickettsiales bacterium]